MSSVLKKPLITEKYTELSEKLGQYGFVVSKNATKVQIKQEIEQVYNVTVKEVRTMVYAGKRKFRNAKRSFIEGRRPSFKKAVVTLKDGDTIDFYSNI